MGFSNILVITWDNVGLGWDSVGFVWYFEDLYKEHWTLEGKALRDFSKSETKRDRKKSCKHYLYVPKKYTSLPNEKGMAQYLGLPRPI